MTNLTLKNDGWLKVRQRISAKKPKNKLDLKEKDKYDDKIESNQSFDKPKEVGQGKEFEILDELKQVQSAKETRYEFRGKFFSCNEIGHMKRDCTNKSFNHVTNFYCHNCHGMGHKEIDCKKPKYDNDKRNNGMSGNTNPIDRRRSNERTSRERRPFDERE